MCIFTLDSVVLKHCSKVRECPPTSDVPVMSSPQLCHCGHRSLSWNVVSFDFQQQCSWLNQKPMRQIPSFMSVSQWAAMSMPPARAPGREKDEFRAKRTSRFSLRPDAAEAYFTGWICLWLKVCSCVPNEHPPSNLKCTLLFCTVCNLNFLACQVEIYFPPPTFSAMLELFCSSTPAVCHHMGINLQLMQVQRGNFVFSV